MTIDERYTQEAVSHFAAQMEHVEPRHQVALEKCFNDDQFEEFYAGLISGLAAAQVLLEAKQPHMIAVFLAFVASKVEAKRRASA